MRSSFFKRFYLNYDDPIMYILGMNEKLGTIINLSN